MTRRDRIINDNIRKRVGVAPIVQKTVETLLRWFGHLERIPVDSVIRRVDKMESSQITIGKGRPRKN
jgi:hypothetical protein